MQIKSNRVIDVHQLTKRYGSLMALDGCELSVQRGSIFGLLGPNGAGKTTLIRCLMGFVRPTTGEAFVEELDCQRQSVEIRKRAAYLPADARLFRMMRGTAVLEFFSQAHPHGSYPRAQSIAKLLALDLSRRVAFMSTGMRQKLAIASVLSCHAPLLILDEPTANLDPSVRSNVLDLIREAQNEGSTVLFSSHILSEIEDLCDTAALMRNGRVVETVNVKSLRSTYRISAVPIDGKPINREFSIRNQVAIIENSPVRFVIEIEGPMDSHLSWLANLPIQGIHIEPTSLQRVYQACCEAPEVVPCSEFS